MNVDKYPKNSKSTISVCVFYIVVDCKVDYCGSCQEDNGTVCASAGCMDGFLLQNDGTCLGKFLPSQYGLFSPVIEPKIYVHV